WRGEEAPRDRHGRHARRGHQPAGRRQRPDADPLHRRAGRRRRPLLRPPDRGGQSGPRAPGRQARGKEGLPRRPRHRENSGGGQQGQWEGECSTLKYGGWGLSLTSILTDARHFVENNNTEFLLLKFDKCKNWELIARAAVAVLGNTLYNDRANLNTKQLVDP